MADDGYGAIIQLALSVVGELLNQDKQDEANALLTQMRTQFQGIELPSLKEIQAEQLGKSAMEGVSTAPQLEQAQMNSLGQLGDITEGNGLSAIDSAALNKIANQVSRRQKAGLAGIESDMAARGQAGTGLDYGLRAQAASDANQRLSEEGQNVGAEALQRRLQAIGQRGEMAGKIRGQSFDEQSAKARAADAIAAMNAAARSQAGYYNAGLSQKNFQNQMQKTGAIANPTNALAGFKVNQGEDTRNALGSYGAAFNRATSDTGKTSTYNGDGNLSDDAYYQKYGKHRGEA